jgi:hypothetical protein
MVHGQRGTEYGDRELAGGETRSSIKEEIDVIK